jgi:hypothetical protein
VTGVEDIPLLHECSVHYRVIVKKIYLDRHRAVAATEQPFVSRESRSNLSLNNSSVLDETVQLHFHFLDNTFNI